MSLRAEVLIAIVGAIVGALIWDLLRAVLLSAKEARNPLSGIWYQESHKRDKNGVSELRIDEVRCVQRGNIVRAKISRRPPQPPHEYEFSGLSRHNRLVGHYWELIPNSDSFGTIFLIQESENHFHGFYTRASRERIQHIR